VKVIHLALRHIQEVESLYAEIQDLNNGKLSHHLIRKQLLQQSLFTVAPNVKSRQKDNNDYYTLFMMTSIFIIRRPNFQQQFTLEKVRGHYILVHVPLTLHSLSNPLTVWRVNSFQMKSPDDQQYYTVLDKRHKYIIYDVTAPYYLVAACSNDMPKAGTTQFVDLQDETVILHRTDIPSCSVALFGV